MIKLVSNISILPTNPKSSTAFTEGGGGGVRGHRLVTDESFFTHTQQKDDGQHYFVFSFSKPIGSTNPVTMCAF